MTLSQKCKQRPILKAGWMQSDTLEKFLANFIGDKTCLNVCSGYSMIGTERIDINGQSWRTKEGDLFNLEYPDGSFDWVYCDPPYAFYVSGENRFRWQRDLFEIASIGLITKRPKVNIHLNSVNHEYHIIERPGRLSIDLLRIDYH